MESFQVSLEVFHLLTQQKSLHKQKQVLARRYQQRQLLLKPAADLESALSDAFASFKTSSIIFNNIIRFL